LIAACAPTPSSGGSSPPSQTTSPPSPKTLRIGLQADREPPSPAPFGSSGTGSSALEPFFLFHAVLTVIDPAGTPLPQLAQKVPSLQDGDWKLLADGGMEVTWKLRPGVAWHDGAPLTADDFVFGFTLNTDPELTAVPGELASISEVR